MEKLSKRSKIMLCVDDTEHSRTALKLAARRAHAMGCPIEILHIIDTTEDSGILGVGDRMRQDKIAAGRELLQEFADLCFGYAGATPSINLRDGLISDEIVKAVKDSGDVKMLVFGRSSEEGNGGRNVAMIAQEIIEDLAVPVLIVPGNLTDQQIEALS